MLPGQAALATPYTEVRPFTPASSFTTALGSLDEASAATADSGNAALDTLLFTESSSVAGPLVTTKWQGTFILVR